jgi:hypothetical protein
MTPLFGFLQHLTNPDAARAAFEHPEAALARGVSGQGSPETVEIPELIPDRVWPQPAISWVKNEYLVASYLRPFTMPAIYPPRPLPPVAPQAGLSFTSLTLEQVPLGDGSWFVVYGASEEEGGGETPLVYRVRPTGVGEDEGGKFLVAMDSNVPRVRGSALAIRGLANLKDASVDEQKLAISFGHAEHNGTGFARSTDWLPLSCSPNDGGCWRKLTPDATASDPLPLEVYKARGGSFASRHGGQIWSEANADGGDLIFHFAKVRQLRNELLLLDPTRDVWLRIRPAPHVDASPAELSTGAVMLAQGGDLEKATDTELEAAQKAVAQGNVDAEGQPVDQASVDGSDEAVSRWSLLSSLCDKAISCKSALRRRMAIRKQKGEGKPVHIVFSVTPMAKYEWQSRFFMFWYNQTQTLQRKLGGTVTRLLSAAHGDHLMDEIPTFVARSPTDLFAVDNYVPYNKITSVMQWVMEVGPTLPDDAIVCILDVDVVLLEDLSHLMVDVKKGKPMGAHGFMSFPDDNTPFDKTIDRYCHGCTFADPLAVPYIIHKDDLMAVAPRWLEKTKEIRNDTLPWASVKDWRSYKPLQLSWTGEQWGYLLASAELGLKHEVRDDLSSFTGSCGEIDEPMLHFSDALYRFPAGGGEKQTIWSKGMPNALGVIPSLDGLNDPCPINRAMIQALQRAHAAVKPTGHVFQNPNGVEF